MISNILFVLLLIPSIVLCIFLVKRFNLNIVLPTGDRAGCMDGLRGYLALMVAGTHYFNFYFWTSTGEWTRKSIFIDNFGTVGVEVFFMITGYLFVTKLLNDSSKKRKTNWRDLYLSRFFRIYPLYFFVLSITIILTMVKSNWQLQVPRKAFLQELLNSTLAIGPSINGNQHATLITAGVTWTLRYEWFFYISLPIVALFIKSRTSIVLFFLGITGYILKMDFLGFGAIFLILFILGGTIAYLYQNLYERLKPIMTSRQMSVVSILSFFNALLSLNQIFRPVGELSVFLFFLPIVFGNSLFGLLRLKSSLILGEISYSIYLIHGIIFYIFFTYFFRSDTSNSDLESFVYMPLLMLLSVFAALFTHRFIERPFINLGARFKSQNDKDRNRIPAEKPKNRQTGQAER